MTARGEIDTKQLNKNYKKLAVKYHPDKNRDDVEAAQAKFIEVTAAKEILAD